MRATLIANDLLHCIIIRDEECHKKRYMAIHKQFLKACRFRDSRIHSQRKKIKGASTILHACEDHEVPSIW